MCNTNSIQKTIDKNINGENLLFQYLKISYRNILKINNT